jgi:hypothetical protein
LDYSVHFLVSQACSTVFLSVFTAVRFSSKSVVGSWLLWDSSFALCKFRVRPDLVHFLVL